MGATVGGVKTSLAIFVGVSVGGIKYRIISRRGGRCGFACHARHFSNRWSYTRFSFSFTYFFFLSFSLALFLLTSCLRYRIARFFLQILFSFSFLGKT